MLSSFGSPQEKIILAGKYLTSICKINIVIIDAGENRSGADSGNDCTQIHEWDVISDNNYQRSADQ